MLTYKANFLTKFFVKKKKEFEVQNRCESDDTILQNLTIDPIKFKELEQKIDNLNRNMSFFRIIADITIFTSNILFLKLILEKDLKYNFIIPRCFNRNSFWRVIFGNLFICLFRFLSQFKNMELMIF